MAAYPRRELRRLLPARLTPRKTGSVSLGHVGYWAAALVIVLMGWTLYGATRDMRDSEGLIIRTLEVLQQVGRVDESIARADAAQRGYMITPVPRFAAERDQALAELSLGLASLRALTADNPRHQARIDAIDKLVAERVAIMRE